MRLLRVVKSSPKMLRAGREQRFNFNVMANTDGQWLSPITVECVSSAVRGSANSIGPTSLAAVSRSHRRSINNQGYSAPETPLPSPILLQRQPQLSSSGIVVSSTTRQVRQQKPRGSRNPPTPPQLKGVLNPSQSDSGSGTPVHLMGSPPSPLMACACKILVWPLVALVCGSDIFG